MTDDHHSHDADSVGVAVLTVSSTRSLENDAGGDAVVNALETTGHIVVERDLVSDEKQAIRSRVDNFAAREDVDAVVTTGGTGLTDDDVTVEAVGVLFDREIPGFGEQFRARSVEEVGPHAMLSRATAGVSETVPIFCLPGSENAARFGTAELVAPVLGHTIGLLQETTEHEQGGSERVRESTHDHP